MRNPLMMPRHTHLQQRAVARQRQGDGDSGVQLAPAHVACVRTSMQAAKLALAGAAHLRAAAAAAQAAGAGQLLSTAVQAGARSRSPMPYARTMMPKPNAMAVSTPQLELTVKIVAVSMKPAGQKGGLGGDGSAQGVPSKQPVRITHWAWAAAAPAIPAAPACAHPCEPWAPDRPGTGWQ